MNCFVRLAAKFIITFNLNTGASAAAPSPKSKSKSKSPAKKKSPAKAAAPASNKRKVCAEHTRAHAPQIRIHALYHTFMKSIARIAQEPFSCYGPFCASLAKRSHKWEACTFANITYTYTYTHNTFTESRAGTFLKRINAFTHTHTLAGAHLFINKPPLKRGRGNRHYPRSLRLRSKEPSSTRRSNKRNARVRIGPKCRLLLGSPLCGVES